MSTIYTFHQECAALGAVPAADDELLIYDTSAGVTKNLTVAQLVQGPSTITSGTTAASLNHHPVPGFDGHQDRDHGSGDLCRFDHLPVQRHGDHVHRHVGRSERLDHHDGLFDVEVVHYGRHLRQDDAWRPALHHHVLIPEPGRFPRHFLFPDLHENRPLGKRAFFAKARPLQ
jgi:hypothetical protein